MEWDRGSNKQLSLYAIRLDQEQDALAIDGVVITNDDKARHYLLEIYNSEIFTVETITNGLKGQLSPAPAPLQETITKASNAAWKMCNV